MIATVLAAFPDFVRPEIDWHAIAPELILVATIVLALLVDVFTSEHSKWTASSIAGLGLLAATVPLLTLATRDDPTAMFGGSYVVDDFALVLKGLFLVAGYLTILLSTNTIAEGDYAEGEYYLLILSSVFGMLVMASSRDLIGIFIALEMLSIPAYLLAGWRKRTLTGNEAGMKYYLMGVFASAVMLYGMSLIFGGTGSTLLADVGRAIDGSFGAEPIATLGIVFVLIGFAFKVSAVPFQNWAPDTYEGAPTPVTAFLSVASKTAGFVAILQLVYVGFYGEARVVRILMIALAAATMTVGNVIALRQSNIVRLFAYSSVAQAGFILAPLAVFGVEAANEKIITAMVTYAIIYTIVNLGAFAVIITVSRKTGTGEISSWGGLWTYAPGLAVAMGAFLFALGGIPIAAGWWAKFQAFDAVVSANSPWGYVIGVVMAVNSVIALGYYLSLMRVMFMDDVPDGDTTPIRVPVPLGAVVTVALIATLVLGVFPGLVSDLAQGASEALAGR
ncbi:MAG: NADH-quinone oxidoreductase subunit N [Acidimicrobiales bacterium]|nr:NADH-quinone oxidoreductase subunit N [Acidimicrobiales bacterium]HRW38413.1 NADH-quinone oxidoreductase subunit N [Aquihabitans sp.]